MSVILAYELKRIQNRIETNQLLNPQPLHIIMEKGYFTKLIECCREEYDTSAKIEFADNGTLFGCQVKCVTDIIPEYYILGVK